MRSEWRRLRSHLGVLHSLPTVFTHHSLELLPRVSRLVLLHVLGGVEDLPAVGAGVLLPHLVDHVFVGPQTNLVPELLHADVAVLPVPLSQVGGSVSGQSALSHGYVAAVVTDQGALAGVVGSEVVLRDTSYILCTSYTTHTLTANCNFWTNVLQIRHLVSAQFFFASLSSFLNCFLRFISCLVARWSIMLSKLFDVRWQTRHFIPHSGLDMTLSGHYNWFQLLPQSSVALPLLPSAELQTAVIT